MISHVKITDSEVSSLIKQRIISLGGNVNLKVYGRLHCASGKRMKRSNRVFFNSQDEAELNGFRPCGHCMKQEYKKWKMTLFNNEKIDNLLPYDGTVIYYGKTMEEQEATEYFNKLYQTIEWKNDEAVIFGKHFITKRKVAWYGDMNFMYNYSNTTKQALPWTEELLQLKKIVEQHTGSVFNSCLLNLYHNGDEGMAWHSDDEKTLGKDSAIASFSFGAERKFSFRHRKTKETTSLLLENGSLLIMKDATQAHWMHSLPKTKKVKEARINLTFRRMINL